MVTPFGDTCMAEKPARKEATMRIFLVRHGETAMNQAKAYYGAMDVPLNDNGWSQAKLLGECLQGVDFDEVYISSRLRAQQTASVIVPEGNLKWHVMEGLDEMNFGQWEGLNYHQVQERYPKDWDAWCRDWLHAAPSGGETFSHFFKRVWDAFEEIMEQAKNARCENIMICAHNGTLRVILAVMCGLGEEGTWHFNFEQDGYSLVEEQWEHFTVRKMNCKDKVGLESWNIQKKH